MPASEIVYDSQAAETDLASGTAWVGGVAPGADDVAVFDGAVPGTLNLGLATEWAGIVRTNVVGQLILPRAPSGRALRRGGV